MLFFMRNVLLAGLLVAVPPAWGQGQGDAAADFPAKPIRIVVGFTPGGGPDVTARYIAQKLGESWKQQVLVENRPGAGGTVAAGMVARAAPDGYTLLSVSSAHAIAAAIYPKLPYDTFADLSGVMLTATSKYVLVVPPSLGIKSVSDLVAAAKAKPGQLNFSSPGVGSANHLAGELFASMAGIKAVHVPYKGIPEAMTAVISGSIQFNFSPVVNVLPLSRDGKLLALAASTGKRAASMPDLPTVAEAGVSGYVFDPWFGMLTRAKTPKALLDKLSREIARVVELPDVREKMRGLGAEPAPTTPDAFDAHVRAEVARFQKIVRDAGIKPE